MNGAEESDRDPAKTKPDCQGGHGPGPERSHDVRSNERRRPEGRKRKVGNKYHNVGKLFRVGDAGAKITINQLHLGSAWAHRGARLAEVFNS